MNGKNKIPGVVTLILVVVLTATVLTFISCGDVPEEQVSIETDTVLVSQASDAGNVLITVTPSDISENASTWNFKIVVDAKNINLDEEMEQAALLVDQDGNDIKPIAWEGDGPGGQHREGVIKFEPQKPMPRSVTLKIRGVGGIGERSFSWMLGQ